MIELVHLVKKFGELVAVNDMSFSLENERPEIYTLAGGGPARPRIAYAPSHESY